jgi:hypothetical protein
LHAAAAASSFSADLSSKLAVAIAPDSWRPTSELSADDFQVATISEVWQKTGYIRVDCQARPGYRLRLVVSEAGGAEGTCCWSLGDGKYMQFGAVVSGEIVALLELYFSSEPDCRASF